MGIQIHYQSLKEKIQSLKPVDPPEIIAVSKTKPIEVIRDALNSGIYRFGENKIKEGIEKFSILKQEGYDFELHHIGPVQTGTLRNLFGLFHYTHGIGAIHALRELIKQANKRKSQIGYFLQANLTLEDAKSGFEIKDLVNTLKNTKEYKSDYATYIGLMTMGPSNEDPIITRKVFHQLHQIKMEYAPHSKLSIGMSSDFVIAIEEGANFLRIGSAIFGGRV